MDIIKGKLTIIYFIFGILILVGCGSIEGEVNNVEQVNETIKNEDESLNYKSGEDYQKAQRIEIRIIEYYEKGDYDTLFLHYKNQFINTVYKIEPTRKTIEIYNEAARDIIEKTNSFDLVNSSGINFSVINEKVLTLYEKKFSKEVAKRNKELVEWEKEWEQDKIEKKAKYQEEREKHKRSQEGVKIGMTREEVLLSNWGQPLDINKTTNAYGTSEQWVYSNYNYLYFDNGILTSIQN